MVTGIIGVRHLGFAPTKEENPYLSNCSKTVSGKQGEETLIV
jgi:hypothetical protein